MPEKINTAVNFPTIDSYQEWVRQDWVHPRGSDLAQQHTRAKFQEEVDELRNVLYTGDKEDIEQELGDLLWTATGTADNSGITIPAALAHTYPHLFDSSKDLPTSMVDSIVAKNSHTFTAEQIDELLLDLAHQLGKNAKQWHFLGPLLDNDDQRTFADAWIQLKEDHAKSALADTVLLASYIAQNILQKSLEDVMITNHAKLSQRLANGQPVTKQPKLMPTVVIGNGVDPAIVVDPMAAGKTMRTLGTSEDTIAKTTIYIGGRNNISTRGFQIKKSLDRRLHGPLERYKGEGNVIRVNSVLRRKTRTDKDMNQTLVHELEHNAQVDRNDKKVMLGNLAIISMLGAGALLGNKIGKKGGLVTRTAATLVGAAMGMNAGYTVAPHEIQARRRAKEVETTAIRTNK